MRSKYPKNSNSLVPNSRKKVFIGLITLIACLAFLGPLAFSTPPTPANEAADSDNAATGSLAGRPSSYDKRRRPGHRSIASVLNADGTLRRDRAGNFNASGYSIAPGIEGAPRFVPTGTAALADSCADGWDERFAANGLNGWVYAIAVAPNGDVYVGGTFSQAGGVAANHIAKWDGLRWSALGSGTNDEVYAITIDVQSPTVWDVYVGGAFSQAGGVTVNHIAKWNGTTWSALGTGMNGFVAALEVSRFNNALYLWAGGNFTSAGNVVPANRIARWDGSAWSTLGVGVGSTLDDAVYALKTPSASTAGVMIGGKFSTAGGVARNNYADWGGVGWREVIPGINGVVEDIEVFDGFVQLGGNFPGKSSNLVYWFDLLEPFAWEPLGSYDSTVYDIETLGNVYRVGGIFTGRVSIGTGAISGEGTHVSAIGLSNEGSTYIGGGFGAVGCRAAGNFGRFFERRFGGSEFSSDWHDASLWVGGGVPGTGTSVNVGTHDAVIVSTNGNARDLRVDNGHTVDVGSTRTLTVFRNLNINDGFITGAGTVAIDMADPNAIYGGGPNGFISTTLSRKVNSSGTFTFPVGSGGLYGGVVLSNITGPATTSMKSNAVAYPGTPSGLSANRLKRWWNISSAPNADLTFHYNDSEIQGNEAAYTAYKISGGVATPIPSVINTSANTVTVPKGTHLLSGDWTLADASGPPVVSTQSPVTIGLTHAELRANIDPNGFSTTLWWRLSTVDPGTCNDSFGETTPHFGVGSGFDPFFYSQTHGTLTPSTTYYYCAIASNSAGTVFGSVLSFTTLSPSPPTVTSAAATEVTTASAALNGSASPNGAAATGWFRYSTTDPGTCNDTFGTRTPASGGTDLGSVTFPVNFAQSISGLAPSTTYYYCAIASNSLGTSFGNVLSFVTSAIRVVDNVTDDPPLVACTSAPDDCNLRGAVLGAASGDEIRFLSPLFDSAQTITVGNSGIIINRRIQIVGPGSGLLTVTGGDPSLGLFLLTDGLNGPSSLTISGIRLFGAPGGAIAVQSSVQTKQLVASGMIFEGNNGHGAVLMGLGTQGTFVESTFRNNQSSPGTAGAIAAGGGTSLVIRRSTFHQNGGLVTIRAFAAEIENSTIHGNSGYGLVLDGSGTITSSTITGNGGGGVQSFGPGTLVRNSIIASNTHPQGDLVGLFTSEGYNFIGSALVVLFNQLGDQVGSTFAPLDPMLGPLADNGGSTWTRAPLSGSPVIDKGKAFGLSVDQTGSLRPVDQPSIGAAPGGDGSDIGAFEIREGGPAPTPTPTPTASPTPGCGWSPAAGYPTATGYQAHTVQDGFLYSFGGIREDTQAPTANSYKFDGMTWTPIAPLPGPRWAAAAVSDGGNIYILGGADQNSLLVNTVYIYDAASNSYITLEDTPLARAFHSAAFLNGKIHIWGGTVDGQGPASDSHAVYNTQNGSWSTAASVPDPAVFASAFVHGGFIYSVGGASNYVEPTPMSTTLRYDPAANTWNNAAIADLPQGRMAAIGSTTAFQGGLALVGGSDNSAISWDAAANVWNPLPSTSVPHSGGVGGVIEGTLYASSGTATEKLVCTGGPTPTPTPVPVPVMTTSPASLLFGSQVVNTNSATQDITISNTAGTAALIWNASITGTDAAHFNIVGMSSGSIPAGGSATVSVRFSPTSIGAKSASVVISGDDAANPSDTIDLSGTGFVPNQAPIAGDDNLIASKNTPLNVAVETLLANDSDPDGGSLSIAAVISPTSNGGTVALTDGNEIVTYTPPNNFTGSDSFTYIVSDGNLSDQGSVTVQVIPPPSVVTNAPTNVAAQTATLNGSANPNGFATTGWFRYSLQDPGTCNDTFGTRAPTAGGSDLGSGNSPVPFSQPLTGLMPDATVYYCAVAQNTAGTSFGAVQSFTPQFQSAAVTTNAATSVTSTSATLNAAANPNGSAATGWFRYSTTNPGTCNDVFGTRAPAAGGSDLGAGNSDAPYSQGITGLTPGTSYFFCAIAQNSAGTSFGAVLQFTTSADVPSVTTSAETLVTSTGATLNGQANPNGGSATAWFRYSTTDPVTCDDTFGIRAPSSGGTSLGAGNSGVTFSRAITGLAAGTRYYFCAIVENSAGIGFGTVRSFTTSPIAPTVTTGTATSVTAMTATLNGTANANGSGTTGWFRYASFNPGTCNDTFGTRAPATGGQSIGNSTNVAPISQAISGLNPNTTYYVCAIAQNSIGTGFGSVMQFTTPQLNVGMQLSSTVFSFGDQTVGTTSMAQNLTITNTGSDPLVLGTLSFADGTQFAFAQDPSGAVVQGGQSVVASITFSPTSLGVKNGSFTIPSNGSHLPTILVDGVGVMPEINVTPLSIDFGTVSTFLGGVRQVTISNTGSENLVFTGVVSGPNAADFNTGLADGTIVQPGTSTQINIFFQPTGTGTRTASFLIGSNDVDEPITQVNLTGVATNPGFLQFSSASYSGNEGDGTIALTVQRVGGSQGAVSAFFGAGGGLATGGEACGGGVDYLNSIPFASFADGDSEPKTVLITVCDDELDENTETFDITLFTDGADVGSNTQAVVAITDNDEAGQISISGRISKSDDSGLSGHGVSLAGAATGTTSSDGTGAFSFDEISSGSYVVTPAADPSWLFDPISRNYPNRTTDVTDANFKAYVPGTEPRTLTVVNGFANPGQQVLVAVVLQSQGNEAGLTFSLSYDPALLSPPAVECGTGSGAGCSLTVNADTPGKIGISVDPVSATYVAGSREVVRILFFTVPNAAAPSTSVTFTDDPATRETSDADANPLLTRYVDGSVVFIHGIESDVSARPTGDGVVSSTDVSQVRRFAVGLDTFNTESNEFQRADSAPYATAGDGRVAATDITQARRYQVGLDPTQPAGGPDSPVSSVVPVFEGSAPSVSGGGVPRAVKVVSTQAGRGTMITVSLHVDADGDENVFGFSLNYDPAVLSGPVVAIGANATGGNVLANTTQSGMIGFSVDFGSGVMPAGSGKELVKITFSVGSSAPAGPTPLTFADAPAIRETSNLTAQPLQTSYEDGFVTVIVATAANASIGGRAVDTNGRGIANAIVEAYATDGRLVSTTRTNIFGYFRLLEVPAGADYIVSASAKRYRFSQPSFTVSLHDNLEGMIFVGRPSISP